MNSTTRIPPKVPGYNTELHPVAYAHDTIPLDRIIYAQAADWAQTLFGPVARLTKARLIIAVLFSAVLMAAYALVVSGYPVDLSNLVSTSLKALPAVCLLNVIGLVLSSSYYAKKQGKLFLFLIQSAVAGVVFGGLVTLISYI